MIDRLMPIAAVLMTILCALGCEQTKPYGVERTLSLPGRHTATWAVAPALNVSGVDTVDPLLQADLVYNQLQQVNGLKIIPVNKVVDVYVSLKIDKIQTPEQAALVCDLLGADAIVVPTITIFDPYDPPKFGASLQLMAKPGAFVHQENVNLHDLTNAAGGSAPPEGGPPDISNADFIQSVGMFDASNGSTRQLVLEYAAGRNDPTGPMGTEEYFKSMDRFCSFVYYTLTEDLLHSPRLAR